MNLRLTIGPRARADLREIWRYTAKEHSPEAADAYLREIDKAMQLVREFRELGSDCSDIRQGYRRIRSGFHLIYYIADRSEIAVIRVLHERMDAESNLRRHLRR